MKRNQEVKFELYELEMLWADGEGWSENNRHHLGTVSVNPGRNGDLTAARIIKAVSGIQISDIIGRKFPALTTTDRRRVYAEDFYGDGTWWEIGAVKRHEPLYGLRLIEEETA